MKSKIGHIYLYVSDLDRFYAFYKSMLELLGYKESVKEDWGFAFINDGTSIWFEKTPQGHLSEGYHRRRTGLNHLAFRVNPKEEVDQFCKDFIQTKGIKTLYETPKAFPEYRKEYYAVYFEDPDRMKLEVAYYP